MKMQFDVTDFDREFWFEYLNDFVPEQVFDAHIHIWDDSACGSNDNPAQLLRLDAGYDDIHRWSQSLYPGRTLSYNLLATPIAGLDLEAHNRFVAREMKKSPRKLGSALVLPQMKAEELDAMIRKYHFTGLKPYLLFAEDTTNSRIAGYLPEHLMEVADEHGMTITLHLSKRDGIADPDNRNDLRQYTARYPRIKWILAHCARSFNAFMLEKAIFELRDMPNLYYDHSAVCDVRSHYLLFKHEKIERMMFGSDNIAAGGVHGNYITWGKAWQFYHAGELKHCNSESTLVVYEQLRAMKYAADMAGLTADDVKKIFHGNAAKLFSFA